MFHKVTMLSRQNFWHTGVLRGRRGRRTYLILVTTRIQVIYGQAQFISIAALIDCFIDTILELLH